MNTTENPILAALTREGVLINVSVRCWRAAKNAGGEIIWYTPRGSLIMIR